MVVTKPSASLAEHITLYQPGAPIQRAAFLGGVPVLVRESGELVLGTPAEASGTMAHADGAILVSAAARGFLVTGGDDGLVVRTRSDGTSETLHDSKGAWIDALTARDDGAVAWAIGKTTYARDAQGVVKTCATPTTGRGLAFAPKGYRLAIAHYNGVSLWFPNTVSAPDALEWKGSHLDVSFSPDGRFVVTSMQESALHGWRIADKANMRMSGYPSKVRSQAWSADGAWLATSGADSCVVWPFRDKDGPMNKTPRECAVRNAKVSKVAFHPKALLLAIGYEDGWIMLARLTDETEMLVRRPDADRGSVSALAWSDDGNRLLFGTASGAAGLLVLPET
jgi:WD40 repeat protein